jgi:hypothetical protein
MYTFAMLLWIKRFINSYNRFGFAGCPIDVESDKLLQQEPRRETKRPGICGDAASLPGRLE